MAQGLQPGEQLSSEAATGNTPSTAGSLRGQGQLLRDQGPVERGHRSQSMAHGQVRGCPLGTQA